MKENETESEGKAAAATGVEVEDPEVNVVEIMRQIREKIRQKRGVGHVSPSEGIGTEAAALGDEVLRYSLEEATIWHDKIYVDNQLRVPITPLDRVVSRIRGPLHELVRFYVNRMCDKQVMVNFHTIKAIGALASEVGRRGGNVEEVRKLREEVQALRAEVEELRKCLGRS